MRFQQKDKSLIEIVKEKPNDYSIKHFHGAGKKYSLICRHGKIVIPKSIQKTLVEWYHNVLCHPGETRTELTIGQHFYWKGLRKSVHDICSKCHTCQFLKRNKRNYGKLPAKQAETQPWDTLCIDLIGKYRMTPNKGGRKYAMKGKKDNDVYLQAITMIDPATGWIEIRSVPEARADLVANQVELAWLTRYPLPNKITVDRGKEFLAEFKIMMENDYGISCSPISVRNPQANAIVERVHQTIGNIIRTFKIQEMDLDNENPWEGILSSTMFAIRSTVHTTTQHTPSQLVFGRDAILNINQEANWQLIKQRKQALINKGNERENRRRQSHVYNTGDKVLLKNAWKTKFNQDAYIGPYTVTEVRNNGTVRARRGNVTDTYNLRNITPFKE